ncbi:MULTISPECIES: stage II sporulation protein M [Mediterraneibacter]|uniref:stage II sporulation protein M n=1 Tax=Mediterraneibacter TaxID=2316020 RepID=UPI000E52C4B6|nr:stage II sporulation protein M [Mediterraneibacter massiliensis]RGT73163.1 stage II sporulation protein M [Ruminococcus sp. AF18-22]
MKILHTRKQLFIFFMPGFLIGIFYINLLAKHYVAEPGIFSDYFLKQFGNVEIVIEEYIWYLLRVRVLPFLLLLGISFTRVRKIAAVLFLVWTGISSGILLSAAVLELGIKGSLLCMVGILPQFLFYIPAYLVLLWYCYSYPKNHWNSQKTVFVSSMIFIGIIVEAYVNPILVEAFLSTL